MLLEELQKLVAAGESENLEFKKTTGQRTEAAKTICALLNGLGGFLLFGVSDRGEITGQQVTAKTLITVPILTPKLSSYWLYFITSASFPLAQSLVESLKNNAICKENNIQEIFPKELLDFKTAVRRSFNCIEEDDVPSSWKDAVGNSNLNPDLSTYVQVPHFGILFDIQIVSFTQSPDAVQEKIWSIGGNNGWRCMNWAWKIRGFIDKLVGGIGLRRGRTHQTRLKEGDALDFWRVLVADSKNRRLLLYTEMKLPGEAWLEFKIINHTLYQTATFRPHGLLGRIYWYMLLPFHYLIFRGLAQALVKADCCIDN